LHEVGRRLGRIVAIVRGAVLQQPALDPALSEPLPLTRGFVMATPCRSRGSGFRVIWLSLRVAALHSRTRAHRACLLELARSVAPRLDPGRLRGEPRLAAEALRPRHD